MFAHCPINTLTWFELQVRTSSYQSPTPSNQSFISEVLKKIKQRKSNQRNESRYSIVTSLGCEVELAVCLSSALPSVLYERLIPSYHILVSR
jgi:hypothetical protein